MHLREFPCFNMSIMAKLTKNKARFRIHHADWSHKYWMEDVHDQRLVGYHHFGVDRMLLRDGGFGGYFGRLDVDGE